MIKGIATVKKKAGMADDEFHRYWRQTHGPLALRMSVLRRYIQSHRTTDVFPGFENCDYDGVAEIWFDDLQTLRGLPDDPEYANHAMADEPNFVEMDALSFLATTEHVFIDEAADAAPKIKAIFLLKRLPGMSVSDFQTYWREQHAPQIPRDAGVLRYVQCHQMPEQYEGEEPLFDGVAELAFADYQAFMDYWTSERIQAIFAADAPKFLDAEGCTAFLAQEYHLR
ncbi:MAG: EthD domain-containing protein [Pseudomonadota bacterium]